MKKSLESSSDKENKNCLKQSSNSILSSNSSYTEVDNDFKDDKITFNEILPENKKEVSQKKMYDIKIIIVGEIGVGKTSVIERYLTNKFTFGERMSISCETQNKSIDFDEETVVNLKIVDTAGEEKFMSLPNQYYKDCQGAIVMYDITQKSSFNKINDWLKDIQDKAPAKIVIILAGNKSDLIDLKFDLDDGLNLFLEKYDHYEISAKTGNNVALVFEKLVNKIMEILKDKGDEEIVERRNSSFLQRNTEKEEGIFKKVKRFFSKC